MFGWWGRAVVVGWKNTIVQSGQGREALIAICQDPGSPNLITRMNPTRKLNQLTKLEQSDGQEEELD
jgi:hypothetical protein